MGIFDFFKSAGKKIPKDADTGASLQRSVESLGLSIKNLHVTFESGVAYLRGLAATQKDLELARLIVGNHEGVQKVNDDGLKVDGSVKEEVPIQMPLAQPTTAQQSNNRPSSTLTHGMYTVRAGDSLSKIAKEQLGSAARYTDIFEANQPMIKDPDEIYPGQVIRIPS
jgi:nucleoid-associated protein YgaU